jgi:DNA-binding NarL/FixJ family response regulator
MGCGQAKEHDMGHERAERVMGRDGPGRDGRGRDRRAVARLTRREAEVLQLVAGGGTSVHIAGRLGIAASTVESHVRSARTKLGVPTRTAAVAVAGEPAGRARAGAAGMDETAAALLDALAQGRLVAQAARDAHVSLRTAHRRLREARDTLGAATTAEAVARWAGGRYLAASLDLPVRAAG